MNYRQYNIELGKGQKDTYGNSANWGKYILRLPENDQNGVFEGIFEQL